MLQRADITPEDLGLGIGAFVTHWLNEYVSQSGTTTFPAATARAIVVHVSTALENVLNAYLMAALNVPGAAARVQSFEAATSSLVSFAADDKAARYDKVMAGAAVTTADIVYYFEAITPPAAVPLEGADDADDVAPPFVNRGNANYRAPKNERAAGRGVTYTGRPH